MFNTTFSRLGELFYKEVGAQESGEFSLRRFLRDACQAYEEHFIRPGLLVQGSSHLRYPGEKSSLMVSLVTSYGRPEITALAMNGQTENLPSLLQKLRGKAEAEFSGLRVSELAEIVDHPTGQEGAKEGLKEKVKERVEEGRGYLLIGNLGLYFGSREKSRLLQRARLEKRVRESLVISRYVPQLLQEAALDQTALHLFSRADSLSVEHDFYAADDIDRNLIHERCRVVQPSPGEYHWHYSLQTTNNQGIPRQVLPSLEDIFMLIQPRYDQSSLQRRNIISQELSLAKDLPQEE